jgi:hypothetical protein
LENRGDGIAVPPQGQPSVSEELSYNFVAGAELYSFFGVQEETVQSGLAAWRAGTGQAVVGNVI